MTFPRGGSEYGGYPGLVQPEPHDVRDSASEQLMLTYLTDPDDEASTPERVADDIRRQGRADRTKQNG
jgi:hypothetical protein